MKKTRKTPEDIHPILLRTVTPAQAKRWATAAKRAGKSRCLFIQDAADEAAKRLAGV